MAQHKAAKVTKEEVEKAHAVWSSFTQFSKIGIIATCVTLVLMALFLL